MDEVLAAAAPTRVVDGNGDQDRPLRLLLVGEGDFSFSVSLHDRLGWPFVSSTVETERSLFERHAGAADNVTTLQRRGCRVLYGVDATRLHEHGFDDLFACVVFNFPHVGGKSNVKRNRELLRLFFQSASQILLDDGCVLVTLCQGQGGTEYDGPRQRLWHDSWQVTAAAAEAQLILNRVVPFSSADFPGYSPRGYRSQDKPFLLDNALTHVFIKSIANDVVELASVDAAFGCGSDVFFDHIIEKCQVTSSGHPCRLLLDAMADALGVDTLLASPVDRSLACIPEDDTHIFEDWPDHSELSSGCHFNGNCYGNSDCCDIRDHADDGTIDCVVHRIERTLPSALLDVVDDASGVRGGDAGRCAVGRVGLRCAAYLSISVDGAKLGRLLDLRFGRTRLLLVDAHPSDCRHRDRLADEAVMATSSDHLPLCGSAAVVLADASNGPTEDGYEVIVGKASVRGSHIRIALDLTAAAACIFDVPDGSWLWSADRRLLDSCGLQQCDSGHGGSAYTVASFVPWSLGAPSYCHDLSFWLPEHPDSFSPLRLCCTVQNAGGLCVSAVRLRDSYRDPANDRISHCYRLHFRSVDAGLTYAQSYACYQRIRSLVATDLGFVVR